LQFERISKKEFSIKAKKSYLPENMKNIIKENGGYYSMEKSRFHCEISKYPKILALLYPLCKTYEFYIEPIPTFVFTGLLEKAPFSDSTQNFANFDYANENIVFFI